MAYESPKSLLSGTAITANGSGTTVVGCVGSNLSILLNVSAVSGTSPSLTVTVEWSFDGATFTGASPADSMAAMTATGSQLKVFTVKAPYARVSWSVSGTTPSLTTSVSAYVTD